MHCQLAHLRHCLRGRIRRALDELPKSLDETYARALEDIEDQNWEYAHRLLQCVAVAARPLCIEELAEFLAFDFNGAPTPEYLEDWRHEDPRHAVLFTCSSLLAVVDVDGSRVIQFTHFSVKEYLTSTRIIREKDTVSRFHISMTSAHTMVAQGCLGVLLHLGENITKSDLEAFPLVEYAAEHWAGHAQFERASPDIQYGMKRLFDPRNHHFPIWIWIHDPERSCPLSERSEYPSQPRATPLHYAAFCDIPDVIEFLIVERSQDVNARGFYYDETSLSVASRKGHLKVVQALLEHGADHETRDKFGWRPLEWVSATEHIDVVQALLDHGAEVKAKDKYKNTSLHVASRFKQAAVARMLLERGAEANARNRKNEIPLHWASEMGHMEGARVLLEYGADVDARNIENATPLQIASQMGHTDLVQLLLRYSADVDAWDQKGQVPFQKAPTTGNHDSKFSSENKDFKPIFRPRTLWEFVRDLIAAIAFFLCLSLL